MLTSRTDGWMVGVVGLVVEENEIYYYFIPHLLSHTKSNPARPSAKDNICTSTF